MLVVDASVVVSALVGADGDAAWADSMLLTGPLCAPHLMPVEVASVLRRAVTAGALSADAASLATLDLRLATAAGARCAFRTPDSG